MLDSRNAILEAFKAVIDAMPAEDFGKPSAEIELMHKKDVGTEPRVEVWFHSDFGSHIDTNVEQELFVTTRVKFKFDPSAKAVRGRTQILQANSMYDAIHAAIEVAYRDRGAAATPFTDPGFLIIKQDRPGIQMQGFDDSDEHLMIGEVWKVSYKRAEGAA